MIVLDDNNKIPLNEGFGTTLVAGAIVCTALWIEFYTIYAGSEIITNTIDKIHDYKMAKIGAVTNDTLYYTSASKTNQIPDGGFYNKKAALLWYGFNIGIKKSATGCIYYPKGLSHKLDEKIYVYKYNPKLKKTIVDDYGSYRDLCKKHNIKLKSI